MLLRRFFLLVVFCDTLLRRSIGRGQPFQLPIDDETEHDRIGAIAERSVSHGCVLQVEESAGWLYVTENTCNHAQLLSVFDCPSTVGTLA